MTDVDVTITTSQPPALPVNQLPPLYFPVSVNKLVVMSIFTGGLYEVYWFYKNWQLIKNRERSNIMPFLRAFFALFFCYALFERISVAAKDSGFNAIDSGPLTVGWIIFAWAFGFLPIPYTLLSVLSVLFLISVQRAVNQINSRHSPQVDSNSHYTGWNILWIVVGSIFWLAFLLALVVA